MSTKPIHLCFTLNFGLLDNHENPGSVGIVFLYRRGTDNLNFRLCELGQDGGHSLSMLSRFCQLLTMYLPVVDALSRK